MRKLDHYIINNKQVVVRNNHLPFVQAFNSKDISQVSPRLRRIFLELAELDIKLTWVAATSMVHVDAISRHPVDPAGSMGPDPIDNQHQHMNDIVKNIEDEDDDDVDNNIEGYQQVIRQMQDGEKIDWKELPTGTKFLVPPADAIKDVLEMVDITHMGYNKAMGCAKASQAKPAEDVMPSTNFNAPSAPFEWQLNDGFARVLGTDGAKVFTGRKSEGEARATWEVLQNMPSRPEGGESEKG